MSNRRNRHGRNHGKTKINQNVKEFAKITFKKFKKDSWYDSKKETKMAFYAYLVDRLPDALEFIVRSGHINEADIQETKNKIYEKLAGKDSEAFIKYLYKSVKKDSKIDNIYLLPIVIKDIIRQADKVNRELKEKDPDAKIYDMSNLMELSLLILKKKIKKMSKAGIDTKLAVDILCVIPNIEVLKYSQIYRIKSFYDILYSHAKNAGNEGEGSVAIPYDEIMQCIDKKKKHYLTFITFSLLEKKERFARMNDNEKALYLKISNWCFKELEEFNKEKIKACVESFVSTRKKDEQMNKDSARRYALSTLSAEDYPRIRKVVDEYIAKNEEDKKYL